VRRLGRLAAAATGAAVAAAAFLTGLAATERDNRFCVSCHLHEPKFERLLASAPSDLAGLHHGKDPSVGCIACHGGADSVMRARVWTVAGIDTLKFLAGAYAEPTHMRLPLRDVECRQCHTPIMKAASQTAAPAPRASSAPGTDADPAHAYQAAPPDERQGQTAFHAIRDHETIDVRCVRCHTAHTTDSSAANRFISQTNAAPVCRECHQQM
jgi:predicted CXXCH cytochrome family protein